MINTLKRGKTGGPARWQTSAGNTGRGLAEISDRKHLTSREVERLMEATKDSRNEVRDRCLLLLMFRHGLRVSEACRMTLDQVDTESRVIHVARLKGGLSTTQPLRGDELSHQPSTVRKAVAVNPKDDRQRFLWPSTETTGQKLLARILFPSRIEITRRESPI